MRGFLRHVRRLGPLAVLTVSVGTASWWSPWLVLLILGSVATWTVCYAACGGYWAVLRRYAHAGRPWAWRAITRACQARLDEVGDILGGLRIHMNVTDSVGVDPTRRAYADLIAEALRRTPQGRTMTDDMTIHPSGEPTTERPRTPGDVMRAWLHEAWLARTRAAVLASEGVDDGVQLATWVIVSARRVIAAQTLPPPTTWTSEDKAAYEAVLSVVARAVREAASGAPAGMVAVYVEEQAATELLELAAIAEVATDPEAYR